MECVLMAGDPYSLVVGGKIYDGLARQGLWYDYVRFVNRKGEEG